MRAMKQLHRRVEAAGSLAERLLQSPDEGLLAELPNEAEIEAMLRTIKERVSLGSSESGQIKSRSSTWDLVAASAAALEFGASVAFIFAAVGLHVMSVKF
jgi:hypothetical protein